MKKVFYGRLDQKLISKAIHHVVWNIVEELTKKGQSVIPYIRSIINNLGTDPDEIKIREELEGVISQISSE